MSNAPTPERAATRGLPRHAYHDCGVSPLRKNVFRTKGYLEEAVKPSSSVPQHNLVGQRRSFSPCTESEGHFGDLHAGSVFSDRSNAPAMYSESSSIGIPCIPTLNLALVNGRQSIPLSSLGEHDQAPPPVAPKTPVANVESVRDIVVVHLNKIQSDLERHLSSVRMEYQIGLSNSVMAGSEKKRSARLLSMSSSDETYSVHSASAESGLFDKPSGFCSAVNEARSPPSMYIGRQMTHIIRPHGDHVSLANGKDPINTRNVVCDKSEYFVNIPQPDSRHLSRPQNSFVFHDWAGGLESGANSAPAEEGQVPKPSISGTPHNRRKSHIYNADMVRDAINSVCAKDGPPGKAASRMQLGELEEKPSINLNTGNVKHQDSADSVGSQAEFVVDRSNGSTNIQQESASVRESSDRRPDNSNQLFPDRSCTKRGALTRGMGYCNDNLAGLLTHYRRDASNVDNQHEYCTVPDTDLNRHYEDSDSLYRGDGHRVPVDTLQRSTVEMPHCEEDSYRVVSVNASDVEDIGREYDAACWAASSNPVENGNIVERSINDTALTHVPTISGDKVKGISAYTLEYLTQLSKVNSKCALLQDRELNASGIMKDDAPALAKTNVTPWFCNPLWEKMWRRRALKEQYASYLPRAQQQHGPEPLDDSELMYYIQQQATYRIDLEEYERHGIMDPFYEYERIRQNKILNDSDWAKYGRPVTKH